MRLKIDENLHTDVADFFRSRSHDVQTVYDEGLTGCADSALFDHSRFESRAIVTLDLDFADIRKFPPQDSPGIVVVRVGSQSRQHVLSVIARAADTLEQEHLAGRLFIISETSIRIRDSG